MSCLRTFARYGSGSSKNSARLRRGRGFSPLVCASSQQQCSGYLVGAILGIVAPALSRTRLSARIGGVVLIVTLVLMPLTHSVAAWVTIRGAAGVASAVVFMVAGNTILSELASSRPHMVGWSYGGVGAGIALPALSPSVPAVVASALLFGATFVGITTLSLATGRHVQVPRAVAILTAGYGIGSSTCCCAIRCPS
ncbi:YbfB/YjiJ family MFS transporter [Gryllotalpicola protaetiae]|uniref:YbfB/YjiJ family MFS transporter n=1 Tax=Gryllotalpicola protaetiae TaxID=2419771 RepID=A0A387BJS6_9MICO|nr:YbfB/YjiJ family MFS transporter [Gryllotalpicola protaetiae]AYG04365.1 YbfB/YjiJ family MFS transporter [Gryllotalpicola protaetiae]